MVSLSVIIVNWNSWEFLKGCLTSLEKSSLAADRFEVIVVDNGSADPSVAGVRAHFPRVRLVANAANVGFPRANNQGLEKSCGKYILLLNPDTIVKTATLERALDYLEGHPDIGCLGVKVRGPDGRIQYHGGRQFPTLRSAIFNLLGLDKFLPAVRLFRSADMAFWNHEDSREVDMISGAFMLFPRKTYEELGGLDTSIPMFFEDMEYCLRIKRRGRKIFYFADEEITHLTGKSVRQAVPSWITGLRLEANRLFIRSYQGSPASHFYLASILMLFPVRLLLIPAWTLYSWLKDGENLIVHYVRDVVYSWTWAFRRLFTPRPQAKKEAR